MGIRHAAPFFGVQSNPLILPPSSPRKVADWRTEAMNEDSEVVKYRQADQDKKRYEHHAFVSGGIPMSLGHADYLVNKESDRKCSHVLRQLAQMFTDESAGPTASPGQGWQLTEQLVNPRNIPLTELNNNNVSSNLFPFPDCLYCVVLSCQRAND